MIASFLLIFCSLGIYSSIESHLFYGRTQGTVISVRTEKYEHSGPDDTTYHTESDILCSYTVGDKEYAVRYRYKNIRMIFRHLKEKPLLFYTIKTTLMKA